MARNAAPTKVKGHDAYHELRRRIVTHELAPGQLLHEAELIHGLSFGRTPIREAIQRLAAEKLVVARPRQTAFVAPILASDLAELVEMRLILECPAARMAAERGTPHERGRLHEAGEAFRGRVRAGDIEGTLSADGAIHGLIAAMARNTFLAENSERLAALSQRVFWISIENALREDAFAGCHDALIRTISSGNAEAAGQAAKEHVALFQARLGRLLLTGPAIASGIPGAGGSGTALDHPDAAA